MSFSFLRKLSLVLGKKAYKSLTEGRLLFEPFRVKAMYNLSFSRRNKNLCTLISSQYYFK